VRAAQPFVGHPGPVNTVAVTPDGTQIITAGADGTARIWDRTWFADSRSAPHSPATPARSFESTTPATSR